MCYPESHKSWQELSHETDLVDRRLLIHLLSLQGDQWAQHRQALHGHLFCLLHQLDQELPGGQQDPADQHREKQGESSPGLGASSGSMCRRSDLGNISGLRDLGKERPHRNTMEEQKLRE